VIELTANYPHYINSLLRKGESDLAFEVLVALEDIYSAQALARDIARSDSMELSDSRLDQLVEMWAQDPGDSELMAFIVHDPPEFSDEQQKKLEEAWGTKFDDVEPFPE
jgi:hypothetical protein